MAGMAFESLVLVADPVAVLLRVVDAVDDDDVEVLTLRAANVSELAFRFSRVEVGKW